LIRKSKKKVVTTIFNKLKSWVKNVYIIVKNQIANIIHAVALIDLSFNTQ
jgi:hypothetical protein